MVLEAVADATERRYKKEPFTKAELTRLLRDMDDWHSAINVRHRIAKDDGWADDPPSLSRFVAAALEEPNLLRRPLIRSGDRVIYSRDAEEIASFLH